MIEENTTIHIRKATLSDIGIKKDIHTLVNNAYQSEGGWTTESHIVGGERSTLEYIETSIKDPHQHLLLAIKDQVTVVGTVQIILEGPEEAGIGMLSVNQKYQSKGIGSRLIHVAMDELKCRGFKYAVLTVLDRRVELLNWYKKIGFVETGERRPFTCTERMKVPDIGFIVLKKALV